MGQSSGRERVLGITVLTVLWFLILAIGVNFSERFDPLSRILWLKLRGAVPAPSEITIIKLDEETNAHFNLDEHSRLSRDIHERLIKKISPLAPRAVVYDILFDGPSLDSEADANLASAVRSLPALFVIFSINRSVITARGPLERRDDYYPYSALAENATGFGHNLIPLDEFSIARGFPSPMRTSRGLTDPLAKIAAEFTDSSKGLPTKRDLINFYGPPGSFKSISVQKALEMEDSILLPLIKDKLIFVGSAPRRPSSLETSRPTSDDLFATGFSTQVTTPGVEVHATLTGNIVRGDWIRRLDPDVEISILAVLTATVSLIVLSTSILWGAVFYLGIALVWAVCAYFSFIHCVYLPGWYLFAFVLPVPFGAQVFDQYVKTYKALRAKRYAFSKYLSKPLVAKVEDDAAVIERPPSCVTVAYLASDISQFSKLASGQLPDETLRFLNGYYETIGRAIDSTDGMHLAFNGDGVEAVWGAVIKNEDPLGAALQTARLMQIGSKDYAQRKKEIGLATRVGIYVGPALMGFIGTKGRFEYGAHDDTAALAAALESLNKKLRSDIVVGIDERVLNETLERNDLKEAGWLRVTSMSPKIHIFTAK